MQKLPGWLCFRLQVWTDQCYIRNMSCLHCFFQVAGLLVAFAYGMYICILKIINVLYLILAHILAGYINIHLQILQLKTSTMNTSVLLTIYTHDLYTQTRKLNKRLRRQSLTFTIPKRLRWKRSQTNLHYSTREIKNGLEVWN